MKNLKNILVLFISLLITLPITAQGVHVEELRSVEPVEFEDYKGPNKVVNTHAEITGIGKNLTKGLQNQAGQKIEKYSWLGLYTIIHAVDPNSQKLNADIFIIEQGATVDTIYNVRRILSGYLQASYGYSYNEAFILAKFITYYNAVYRSDIKYFETKYSPKVLSYLSEKTVGLSKTYKEWPGKTQIIIPLAKGNNAPDTSNITDKKVISKLRETEPDRGVADRKKIVEIKKDDLQKDQKELKKKTAEAVKTEKEIQKKEQKIEQKKAAVEKISDPEKKEEAKKELAKELVKEQQSLETQKKDLSVKKDEIKQDQKAIDEKKTEIKQDEKEISEDEKLNKLEKDPKQAVKQLQDVETELKQTQAELKKEKDSIMQDKLYYLKVKEWQIEGHYDNDMVIIDPRTRKVVVRSPVQRIDCNKYLLNEKGVVVIIHNDSNPKEHNLALLDKDNLTLIKKGSDDVFWRSFIEDRDGFIYVIIFRDESYYLGRFTYDLQLDKVSTVKMDRDSFVSFFEDAIFINRSDKNIIVLNKNDLSFLEEIKP
jgi:hypothetical protein